MAVPASSKEEHGLHSRRRKHHISESGVLVIEHSELSDAGQSPPSPNVYLASLSKIFNTLMSDIVE